MSESIQADPNATTQLDVGITAENSDVLVFKQRMLEWANPVEYVNNMYGCHPGYGDTDYFKVVYGK